MVSALKYVKNGMLSGVTAALSFLGSHSVRWMRNQHQKTNQVDEVDQVAQQGINQQLSSHSSTVLTRKVRMLDVSTNEITMGQGEYIVFHQLPNGERKSLSDKTFARAYEVLVQFSTAKLENGKNRYELLKARLKEIDSTIEAFFVPRTLYELIFIKNCIQEDLRRKEVCRYVSPSELAINLQFFKGDQKEYTEYLNDKKKTQEEEQCWHLCRFKDTCDDQDVGVKNIAYRLNKIIFESFLPSDKCFTYQQLSKFAEQEIQFLKTYYQDCQVSNTCLTSCNITGPTINFSTESERGLIKPMGIRDETDAEIIRKAIALECSQIAQHSLLLYRGADFEQDSIFSCNNQDIPYSLSYGTSLFSGCIHDGGATAFYFMRNRTKDAYAVAVPFDQKGTSPFYIPPANTVSQLFGCGETFHSRTKYWKDSNHKEMLGMSVFSAEKPKKDHLASALSKEELSTQFQYYKSKAIFFNTL